MMSMSAICSASRSGWWKGRIAAASPMADPARARGRGGGEARRIHRQAVVDEVVLGQPDLVEAELFRPLHLLELAMDHLGVGEAGRGLGRRRRFRIAWSRDYSAP